VHRIARIRRQERDLFGRLMSVWQVIRTSNAYQLLDPLERDPGRRAWCKSENPARPQNQEFKQQGARLAGAQVTQGARQEEHASAARLSPTEHAALIARLDSNPTKADWAAYERDLDAMLTPTT